MESFSGRWREIKSERSKLESRLTAFPGIPIDDQGGTGGYAGNYSQGTPAPNSPIAVEVHWQGTRSIDLVSLFPARRYDANGLDAQYGLPLAFTVELLDAGGKVIHRVASEADTSKLPVRKGHPFVYAVSPPVPAAALRISADRLNPYYKGEGMFVHAWAEAMAFEGENNVALNAEVRTVGGVTPPAPWQWNPTFLVDGQTPLGLPEVPAEEHGNVGWISEARTQANDVVSLNVDLGEVAAIDGIRLVPARKPTSDLPSGFGFPRKLRISLSDTEGNAQWTVASEREWRNPGHNPVLAPFHEAHARFIKIEATQLWKAFDDFPAFLALSELEVLSNGKNLARDKGVGTSDGMVNLIAAGGRMWTAAALTDGFGPDGRLVSTREWSLQLDQRLRLEMQLHGLTLEATQLMNRWARYAKIAAVVLVLACAVLIIILPIRYRLHANRELVKVRERIAGDLHDEVGSNLGSIQMFADLAEGRSGSSDELKRIQRIAAETVSAVRDIVWLLRPTGDHRIGTVEHLRETSSIMLESLEWKFIANDEAWNLELREESNRDLFLFFREALHNIMRHAKASAVEIRAEISDHRFRLDIHDNGVGIEPERLERPSTFRALRQRAEALAADFKVDSEPGKGTHLMLSVPLDRKRKQAASV